MSRRILIKAFLAAAAAATATTTSAQTAGGPPVAYVKRVSNGDEIYLVNPDKTGLIRVYKARSKTQIPQFDLRPGGGEIAFPSTIRGGQRRAIRVSSAQSAARAR